MSRQPLGQHFLVDDSLQKQIVSYFAPTAAFMEIGPGKGALTQHLEKKHSNFWVCELDSGLASEHRQHTNYKTLVMDFLSWDFKLNGKDVEGFSFIGNLPYESGSKMLQRICENAHRVHHFVFLFQREVVERLTAKEHTREFGSLTVLAQGQFNLEPLDVISPQSFRPPPKVFSQLVRGYRRNDPHPLDEGYRRFLKRAFLHKRKTLRNAWKGAVEEKKMDAIFSLFNLDSKVRAEEISVDVWPKIFEEFMR